MCVCVCVDGCVSGCVGGRVLQAARVAGMAREREREQARLECAIASDALASEKPAVDTDVLMLIEGLHRRATGAPASTRHASVDEDDGDNGLFVVVRKKRTRKKLDPYEKIPFFVAEIMYVSHMTCCSCSSCCSCCCTCYNALQHFNSCVLHFLWAHFCLPNAIVLPLSSVPLAPHLI